MLNEHAIADKLAMRLGRLTQCYMREDFLQEVSLAICEGKDPRNAVVYAYRYWCFGYKGHRRVPYDKPQFLGPPKDDALVVDSVESYVSNKELIEKIWAKVSAKARAAIKANLLGEPYVWRPEIKEELRNAVIAT